MLIDTRKIAQNEWYTKLAIVSNNSYDQGGLRPLSFFRRAKKVSQDQGNVIGGVNVAREVRGNQYNVIGGVNVAREVGGDQYNVIGLGNVAREVRGDQYNVIGGVNVAREVGGDQGDSIGGLVNYAGRVNGTQSNAVVCVQTKNRKARQKRTLVRYNPAEKLGFGKSVWSKIEKADNYFRKIKSRYYYNNAEEYHSILKTFVRENKTLRRRLTGHWTYADVLSRQAKRILERTGKLEQVAEAA